MSKDRNITNISQVIACDLTYIPSDDERRVKASFWKRFTDTPICNPNAITLAAAQSLLNDSRLDRWWSKPGFKEWFANQEEWRERAEYIAQLALGVFENLLTDPATQAATKYAAARDALKLTGKFQPTGDGKSTDEMTPAELRHLIRQNSDLIKQILSEDSVSSNQE